MLFALGKLIPVWIVKPNFLMEPLDSLCRERSDHGLPFGREKAPLHTLYHTDLPHYDGRAAGVHLQKETTLLFEM